MDTHKPSTCEDTHMHHFENISVRFTSVGVDFLVALVLAYNNKNM